MAIAQMIFAAAALATAAPLTAAEWYYIGENDEGIAYIDTTSIEDGGDRKTFDAFIAYFDPVGDVSYIVANYEMDCEGSTAALLRSEGFDRSRTSRGTEEGDGTHEPIGPDTIGDLYYTVVCLDHMDDAIAVDDPFEDASGAW